MARVEESLLCSFDLLQRVVVLTRSGRRIAAFLVRSRDYTYLPDGLETRMPPHYQVHIPVFAVIVTGEKKISQAVRSYRGCLGNTNGDQPDNGVGVCEGIYSRP